MAYDFDLRKRAIELLDLGHSARSAGELLGVSQWTISGWRKRHSMGVLAAQYPASRGAYSIDESALTKHLSENPDAYLSELAAIAGGTAQGVSHALKRLGITRKSVGV